MPDRRNAVVDQARRLRLALLQRHGYESDSQAPTGEKGSSIEDAAMLARVSSHWGIVSEIPLFGRLVVLAQRAIRIALRWYINPVVDQQNAFNDAVVRSLYELQAENDRLRALIPQQRPSGEKE